jgi:hypothetical protein
MTDEEAAVIEAAYTVDRAFFPPDPDRGPSVFLAVLDTLHRALLRLEQARTATEVTEAAAEAARVEASR